VLAFLSSHSKKRNLRPNDCTCRDVWQFVKLLRLLPAVVVLSNIAVAMPAGATPSVGVSALVLSKQTVDGKDYIVSDITLAPGASTGWHTHQGEIYGIVQAGTLTHYGADCRRDGVYGPGTPITDPTGADHVHLGRNEGTVSVVLRVTYVDAAGSTTSDSAPNPGCHVE
jgi:quercetin dioxygenase-like cupin family protein